MSSSAGKQEKIKVQTKEPVISYLPGVDPNQHRYWSIFLPPVRSGTEFVAFDPQKEPEKFEMFAGLSEQRRFNLQQWVAQTWIAERETDTHSYGFYHRVVYHMWVDAQDPQQYEFIRAERVDILNQLVEARNRIRELEMALQDSNITNLHLLRDNISIGLRKQEEDKDKQ